MPVALEPRALRRELQSHVARWETVTAANVAETRGLLQTVLRGRIAFQPVTDEAGGPAYELTMPIAYDRILSAAVPALERKPQLASSTGADGMWKSMKGWLAA